MQTTIDTLPAHTRESLQTLAQLGIEATNNYKERLSDVRIALAHPSSKYATLSPSERAKINDLITKVIGEKKPAKPCAARVSKPFNFSHLDEVECHPNLREILINRLPHRPRCSSNLSAGTQIRRLDQALKHQYIQFNPPEWLSAIVVDIDRKISDLEWQDAGLPAPTWITKNKKNGHAHMVWVIQNPIWEGGKNQKPAQFYDAIKTAFTQCLRGDEGYANFLTKNPASTAWEVSSASNFSKYDLGYLAEFVDLKKLYKQRKKEPAAITGVGRNCTLFDELREWAYPRSQDANLGDLVMNKAVEMNANFNSPMNESEVRGIAKSITKFCQKMDGKNSEGFFNRQMARSKLATKARTAKTESNAAKARLMHSQGMSNCAIGRELKLNRQTIARYLQK